MIRVKLTTKKLERVRNAFKKCKDLRLKERFQAVLLSNDGKSAPQIASIIGRDEQTVRSYLKAYLEKGEKGLKMGKSPGRPSSLNEKEEKELASTVSKNPRFSGQKFSNWDCPKASVFVYQKFGVKLTPERIRQILHEKGLSLQKPGYSYIKASKKNF